VFVSVSSMKTLDPGLRRDDGKIESPRIRLSVRSVLNLYNQGAEVFHPDHVSCILHPGSSFHSLVHELRDVHDLQGNLVPLDVGGHGPDTLLAG